MEQLTILLGWVGLFATVGFSAIGSIIGCAKGGQAACGAMLDTETGHGKFIGLSAMPSSQSIYGIVLMFVLKDYPVNIETGGAIFAIGLLAGLAFLWSAMYQGECCAAAISASKSKPEIFGKTIAPAGIVEGFAIFVLIMAIVLSQNLKEIAEVVQAAG